MSKYNVYVAEPVGTYESFTEALKLFLKRIDEMFKNGGTWQVLETMCWIEREVDGTIYPAMFYDLRDFACQQGILVDQKIVDDAPEINEETVCAFYATLQNANEIACANYIITTLQKTLETTIADIKVLDAVDKDKFTVCQQELEH